MMIVMKSSASEAEIEAVIDRIHSVGAVAHPSRGEEVTVIGAIGDREHVARLELDGAPGVSQVVPMADHPANCTMPRVDRAYRFSYRAWRFS